MYNEKVRHFTVSTNVVSVARLAMGEHSVDAFTMIKYIQPVSNIVAIPMNSYRFVV